MIKRIRDIDVTYNESGSGEPVILVHGLAEDHRSFAGVQQALQHYHTFAYDLRGHGGTTVGDANGTLAELGEDLIAFLEIMTGPAKCVGYSLGGTVVLWAAVQRPDLIKQAVVVGTSTVVGRAAAEFFAERIEVVQNDLDGFGTALRNDTAAQIVSEGVDIDEVTRRRLEAIGDGAGYINAARAMIGVNKEPLTPELGKINCRVDVVGGDGDVFCPRKAADIILEGLKDGHYHEVSAAGHLISVDQPDAYAATLANALSQNPV